MQLNIQKLNKYSKKIKYFQNNAKNRLTNKKRGDRILAYKKKNKPSA